MKKKRFGTSLSLNTLPISCWPTSNRYPGLANSWEGAAWVCLHLAKKNENFWNARVAANVYNRLKTKPPYAAKQDYFSLMMGFSARPIIAALAGKDDALFRRLLPQIIHNWLPTLDKPGGEFDLMLGKAGALLACSEIETIIPGQIPSRTIKNLSAEVQKALTEQLDLLSSKKSIYLGLSHGLSGYLLALENSQFVFHRGLASNLRQRLINEIMDQRFEIPGDAAIWPIHSNTETFRIHSWCHGAPGIGLGLIAGFGMTGLKEYKQAAKMALRGSIQIASSAETFCCGSVGKAQILIEAYRITGNKYWLKHANFLNKKNRMIRSHQKRKKRSFHRGYLGEIYLQHRLEDTSLPLIGLGYLSV